MLCIHISNVNIIEELPLRRDSICAIIFDDRDSSLPFLTLFLEYDPSDIGYFSLLFDFMFVYLYICIIQGREFIS